ncbi:hypothetical protein ACFQY5_04140 [Paeniroseomonas aquatica]|uniref:hypothetical protein n=1 Tax=Paeniroseomonas aquatica TaxID=373043 RepID=UPI0036153308
MVGAGAGGLRLRALRDCTPGAALQAWCRGIEVGRLPLAGVLAAGDILELPVTRLPCVPLPASLQIAAAAAGPELAAPWPIASPEAALALLGPGAPVLEDLRLESGMLRGTGIERRNGLVRPVLHAILNGSAVRAVQVERPVPLAEGGCAFRFAMALEPADLNGGGLDIALHAPGTEAPLARFAWAPALPGAEPLAALEARVLRLEQAGQTTLAGLQAMLDRRLEQQQDRIDAFIEAAASLLLDRLLLEGPEETAGAALRALIAGAVSPPPAPPPVAGGEAMLAPSDAGFDLGWHAAEEDAEGGFRWMSLQGLVRNPAPMRPVDWVEVAVGHLYGAPAPALEASFDAKPCLVEVSPEGPHHYRLRITPPGGAAPCQVLRLQALAGGSPAEDGVSGDDRLLSIAVTGIVFAYADPGSGPAG